MSLAILFHFLCAQHFSDINISIIRSLRLFCWITTSVVSVLQASVCNTDTTPTQPHWNSNTHRTKNNKTNVVIQQNSRKLLIMDILMSEIYWAHKKWNKIASDIKLVFYSSTTDVMFGNMKGFEFTLKIIARDMNNETFKCFRNKKKTTNSLIIEFMRTQMFRGLKYRFRASLITVRTILQALLRSRHLKSLHFNITKNEFENVAVNWFEWFSDVFYLEISWI